MPYVRELKFLALAHGRLQQSAYLIAVSTASVNDARLRIAKARNTLARSEAILQDLGQSSRKSEPSLTFERAQSSDLTYRHLEANSRGP